LRNHRLHLAVDVGDPPSTCNRLGAPLVTTDAGLPIATTSGLRRVGKIDLRLPKLRSGSYDTSILRAARPENPSVPAGDDDGATPDLGSRPVPQGRTASVECVYSMRMARVNVYLPDDLADAARAAGLNVSGITQAALMSALAERDTNDWLDSIDRMRSTKVTHADALEALHAARDEMGTVADA